MPVFRSPPPVRQSPRVQPDTSLQHDSSFASNASTRRRAAPLPNSSVPSTPFHTPSLYPSLPNPTPNRQNPSVQPAPFDEFPSLDQMAEAGRQERELSARNTSFTGSRGYTVSTSASFSSSSAAASSSSARAMPSSSTTVQVPSSLPRPNKARPGTLYDRQHVDRPVTRRSSLTAIEAARWRAGNETPTAVTTARQQQQAAGHSAAAADPIDESMDDDDDDVTAALICGPNGATSASMSIDIESGKMPTLRAAHQPNHSSAPPAFAAAVVPGPLHNPADLSTESQRSSRHNGQDRPIASGYDFSKYLDEGMDPFNANKRSQDRRESRPLPVPAADALDDDPREASRSFNSNSGDDTLRGSAALRQPAQTVVQGPPLSRGSDAAAIGTVQDDLHEHSTSTQRPAASQNGHTSSNKPPAHASMPPPSQLPRPQSKALAAPASQPVMGPPAPKVQPVQSLPMQSTPRMTPHGGSRKISHLAGITIPALASATLNGVVATPGSLSMLGDESNVTASAQKRRLDPAARNDRLMSLELAESKKKVKLLTEKLEASEEQRKSTLEESEGWASEAARLEEDVARLRSQLDAEASNLDRLTSELEARVLQHKLEAEDKQWRLMCRTISFNELEADLVYCRNETTYESHRGKEMEANLLMEKDDLRIRLMAERKRGDLLVAKLKTRLKETLLLRKRLSTRIVGAEAHLRNENERLTGQVEALQADLDEARSELADLRRQAKAAAKNGKASAELQALQDEVAELKEAVAAHEEREEMMAETRKVWRKERKEMQAQLQELQAELDGRAASASTSKRPNKKAAAAAGASLDVDAEAEDFAALSDAPIEPARGAKKAARKDLIPASGASKSRRKPMQGASDVVPSEADLPPSSPTGKVAKKKASAPSALARSALAAAAAAQSKKKGRRRYDSEDEEAGMDVEQEAEEEEEELQSEAASDSSEDQDDYAAPVRSKKGRSKATSRTKATGQAGTGRGKKAKAPVAVEYDDQTADPSATPMIRSKRSVEDLDHDDDEAETGEVEDSFQQPQRRGRPAAASSHVGKDRTNTTQTGSAVPMGVATAQAGGAAAGQQQQQKKKKRKLLGGGQAGGAGLMNWGTGQADENGGLQPNYNIPLELSPIKPVAGGGGSARSGGFFGFGTGRGPFG